MFILAMPRRKYQYGVHFLSGAGSLPFRFGIERGQDIAVVTEVSFLEVILPLTLPRGYT